MDLFSGLTVINGVGPATRLGGLALADEVWDAMRASGASSVRMDRLQEAAGDHLAAQLKVPAVYVTSGAAAALHLAASIAMTRGAAAAIDRLPDTAGLPGEIVIQAAHRDPYDRVVEMTGARLRQIGYPDSTHPGELERALDGDVAAVLFRPGRRGNLLDLATTAKIAHAYGVPVIVDGALYAPPVARLHGYLDDGADLVAVSGGKGFRGPQASGLLVGRMEYVALAGLHHHDMDERSESWKPPTGVSTTPPRHGPARSMKVGREQIAGLVAAVDRYLRDPGADERQGIAELEVAAAALEREPLLQLERVHDDALDVPTLHLAVVDVDAVIDRLASGEHPTVLGESEAWRGVLTVNPMALRPEDGALLAEAVIKAVRAGSTHQAREQEQ